MTFEEYYRIGKEVISRDNALYVSIDVEGDGPAGYGSLASVGAVAATGEEFYVEVSPQLDTFFPECRQFLDGLGMTREYLQAYGSAIDEAGKEMRQWCDSLSKRYRKPLVATVFNAGYDWAHIDLMFAQAARSFSEDFPRRKSCGQPNCNPFGVAPFDSKTLAICLDIPHWSWQSTERSMLPLEITPNTPVTHHALDDARRQLQQLYAMAGFLCVRQAKV